AASGGAKNAVVGLNRSAGAETTAGQGNRACHRAAAVLPTRADHDIVAVAHREDSTLADLVVVVRSYQRVCGADSSGHPRQTACPGHRTGAQHGTVFPERAPDDIV